MVCNYIEKLQICCNIASIIRLNRFIIITNMQEEIDEFMATPISRGSQTQFKMKDLIDQDLEFYEGFKTQEIQHQSDEQPSQKDYSQFQSYRGSKSDIIVKRPDQKVGIFDDFNCIVEEKGLIPRNTAQKYSKNHQEALMKSNKQVVPLYQTSKQNVKRAKTQQQSVSYTKDIYEGRNYQKKFQDDFIISNQRQPTKQRSIQSPTCTKKIAKTPRRLSIQKKSQQSQSVNSQDEITFQSMLASKKRQSFNHIQQWDNERIDILDNHETILESFLEQIDNKIKQSKSSFEIYLHFFKQQLKQQETRLKKSPIDTKILLQDNLVSKTIYVNCSVALNTLSDQMVVQKKKIEDFIQILKNTIIKDRMEQTLTNGSKKLLQARQNIIKEKQYLLKNSEHVEDTLEQLLECYKSDKGPSKKDFYLKSIKFLRRISRQVAVQKKLASLIIKYYRLAIAEEFNRASCIRQSLIIFSKAIKIAHDFGINQQDWQQLKINELEQQQIKQFYELKHMIDQESKEDLKRIAQKTGMRANYEFSQENFQQLITSFIIKPFNEKISIMKAFEVQCFNKKSNKLQPCSLVITIDAYIHLFINRCVKDPYKDPDASFLIRGQNVTIKSLKGSKLQIIKKQDKKNSTLSYFWDTKKNPSYEITFLKADAKEQFLLISDKLSK